jgi:peroxiredoxin/uncharacterized membrane protein YphA (DoxX/SURF4 family)
LITTVTLLVLVRLGLAATFAVAGIGKISAPNRTRRALEQFGVPRKFTRVAGAMLPLCEFFVALGLVRRATVHLAAGAALGLLCAFTAAVIVSLWNGRKLECACFGGTRPSPIGAWTIGRNLILATVSAVLLLFAPSREFVRPGPSGGLPQPAAIVLAVGLGLGLLGSGLAVFRGARRHCAADGFPAAISTFFGNKARPMFKRVRPPGLVIGTNAPPFALPLLDGGIVTLESLVQGGRSALMVFARPGCGQCAALIPALARLQESRGKNLRVAVICLGDPESSRRMIGRCTIKIAATDDKAQIARLFRVPGVPSAVLIGPQGAIASETVAGAQALNKLMTELAQAGSSASQAANDARPAASLRG